MSRIGNMYGPDATFLGVPAVDLSDPASFSGTNAVIIGAPFDGGTSHRPGARFGPQAIRFTDYLPHDGSRPHLALGYGTDVLPGFVLPPRQLKDLKILHGSCRRVGYDAPDAMTWVDDFIAGTRTDAVQLRISCSSPAIRFMRTTCPPRCSTS